MGLSTDAYLWFGLELKDDDDDHELPPHVKAALFAAGVDESDLEDDTTGAVDKFLKPFGCELASHCSYDYPMYFLAATGSQKWAYRGSPVLFSALDCDSSWPERVKAAANALGIAEPAEPTWILASMMG